MPANRDVSPIFQAIRDYLLGRKNMNHLRFAGKVSARTQPPPKLPDGPNSKLSNNYYYARDARRLVLQNEVVVEGSTMLTLPEGGEKPSTVLQRVPGKIHNWDL